MFHLCSSTVQWVITPCACTRGKAVGFVCRLSSVVGTKIATSQDLGIWATRKHNESVKIGKKVGSVCFNYFGTAHERHKQWVLLATPIDHTYSGTAGHVLSAHVHNSPSIRRKRSSTKHIRVDQCRSCSTQIHADAAHGVCALKSSCFGERYIWWDGSHLALVEFKFWQSEYLANTIGVIL